MLYDGTVPTSPEFGVRSPVLLCLLFAAGLVAEEPVRITADGSHKQNLQWSPDGSRLLMTRIHQGKMALWTMSAEGSDLKRLVAKDTPNFDGHWSPDGKKVVFV